MDQQHVSVSLRFAPDFHGSGDIFNGQLRQDAIDSSSVLSCIVEGGGEAILPDCITLPDFTTWVAAFQESKEDSASPPLRISCVVVQVADVLDDKLLWLWILKAGKALLRNLSHWNVHDMYCNELPHIKQAVTHGIDDVFHLPDHLQVLVFSKAMALDTQLGNTWKHSSLLQCLLDTLPSQHHHTVLNAALQVLRDNTLTAILSGGLIKALQASPSACPLVTTLDILGVRAADASTLSSALRRLTGLEKLTLRDQVSQNRADTLQLLDEACGMESFPSISSLSIDGPFRGCQATALASLFRIVSSLQNLQALSIGLDIQVVQKLQGVGLMKTGTQEYLAKYIDSVTLAASSLTRLSLALHGCDTACLNISGSPIELPHLQQLTVQACSCLSAAELLGHIEAPITYLSLLETQELSIKRQIDSLAVVEAGEKIYNSLFKFKQLQVLNVVNSFSLISWQHYLSSRLFMGLAGIDESRTFSELQELHLAFPRRLLCMALKFAETRHIDAFKRLQEALRRFHVDVVDHSCMAAPSWDHISGSEPVADVPLTSLAIVNTIRSSFSLSHLRPFPWLTRLQVHSITAPSPGDLGPLALLKHLQLLSVKTLRANRHNAQARSPSAAADGLIACLSAMPELKYLALGCPLLQMAVAARHVCGAGNARDQPAEHACAPDAQRARMWPSLEEVTLLMVATDRLMEGERSWDRILSACVWCMCAVRSLKRVRVCVAWSPYGGAGFTESAAFRMTPPQQIRELQRSCELSCSQGTRDKLERLYERLERTARNAAVELSIEVDRGTDSGTV